jgi:hypothetical protein
MGVELGLWHLGKNILNLFQNRVLKRIFGTKRDEVTRRMRLVEHIALMGELRNA